MNLRLTDLTLDQLTQAYVNTGMRVVAPRRILSVHPTEITGDVVAYECEMTSGQTVTLYVQFSFEKMAVVAVLR